MPSPPAPSREELLTDVYVFVDDYLKAHPRATQWRTSNNRRPAVADAEVLTPRSARVAWGPPRRQADGFAAGNLRRVLPSYAGARTEAPGCTPSQASPASSSNGRSVGGD